MMTDPLTTSDTGNDRGQLSTRTAVQIRGAIRKPFRDRGITLQQPAVDEVVAELLPILASIDENAHHRGRAEVYRERGEIEESGEVIFERGKLEGMRIIRDLVEERFDRDATVSFPVYDEQPTHTRQPCSVAPAPADWS